MCPRDATAEDTKASEPADKVELAGYVELYGHYNLRRPSNAVTNLRGFDVRHASMALQNAVLDTTWTKGAISGRVAFQVGDAGSIYYASEPALPSSGTAPASDASSWRHVQEARLAWDTPWRVQLAAGLFLSPIGPESVATRDNWNWSRSNLFFALPSYHLGARASVPVGGSSWTITGAVYNGWNNTIDANRSPAVSVSAAYAKDDRVAQVLYFGGVERAPGSADGQPWRHLFDAYLRTRSGRTSVMGHVDGGLERGDVGTRTWLAGAGYVKVEVSRDLALSARGDVVREQRGSRNGLDASPILLPVQWIASATATIAYRPVDGLDVRFEYRHDHADDAAYFGGTVMSDPVSNADIPNRRTQDTVTIGIIAWF